MLNIVADESVDFGIVQLLRSKNLNVISIQETHGGVSDEEVLQVASKNNAILITEDKDFGELVYRLKMEHCGIILIRIINMERTERITFVSEIIAKNLDELANSFSVLTESHIRIRKAFS